MLSGSDFTPKPKGFGPATSYKLIQSTAARVDELVRSNHKAFAKWTEDDKDAFLSAYPDAVAKFMSTRPTDVP